MQIFLQRWGDVQDGRIPEFGLMEFQGTFESRNQDLVHGQHMGDLNYTSEGKPFFIVGHHVLRGTEVKLAKPMAIMERSKDSHQEFLITGVIRRKIIFKTRPEFIVGKHEA